MSTLTPAQEELAQTVAAILNEALRPLKAEVELLRSDVELLHGDSDALRMDLERLRMDLKRVERSGFRGVWRSGEEFEKNALVICDNQLWAAAEATSARPGTGSWRKVLR